MRFILPLLLLSNFLFGQNLTPKKYEDANQWGYEDEKGLMIIDFDFIEAYPFEGDFAIVKKKYGYGVINKKGETIFRCNYDKVDHWQNGIFLMSLKNRKLFQIGLANEKKTLNSRYNKSTFFYKNELRAYSSYGTTIISESGEVEYLEAAKDIVWVQDYGLIFKEKWGCIDSNDQLIVPFEYDTIMFSPYLKVENEHTCIARKNNKWYRLGLNKKPIEIQEYDSLEYLKNGKILFRKKDDFGIIELSGNEMKASSWKDILSVKRKTHNGGNWSIHTLCDQYGVFDSNYKPLIPPIYKSLNTVYGTDLFIAQKDELFGLINIENKVVIDFKYESLTQFMRSGLYALQNGKLGIIDFDGKIIIPFDYEKDKSPRQSYDWWDGQYVPIPIDNIRMKKNGKVGIIDLKNDIIIPFEYEEVKGLNTQRKYYQAKKNGKWGVLNSKNEWIVSPEFDAFSFMIYYNVSQGYYNRGYGISNAIMQTNELQYKWMSGDGHPPRSTSIFLAEKNGKKTAFNLAGKQLFPLEYFDDKINDYAQVFHYKLDTLILAGSKNGYGLVDQKGRTWLDFVYQEIQLYKWDIFLVSKNNKYGLIHKDGSIIQPIDYQDIKGQKILRDGKYGILNKNRKSFLLDVSYDAIEIYDKNYPYFLVSQNKKWGWNDQYGEEVIPIIYDSIVVLSIHQKMAKVLVNDKWGIIKVGVEGFVLPAKYEEILMEEEKVKVRENEKWKIIDLENNNTITKDWDEINGRTVRQGKYWGLINEEGELISEIEYEIILYHQISKNIPVKKNGKWGIINPENKIILNFKYDEINFLYNGFIKVRKGENWGIINSKEELILDYKYERIERLANDFFQVYQNGKWGVISNTGKIITKIEYDYIQLFSEEKVILAKKDGKTGIINFAGEIKIDFIYESIGKYEDIYLVSKKGKIGIVNSENKFILPIEYTSLYKRNLFIESYKDGKRGLINLKGKVILKCKYDEIIYDESCLLEGCPIAVRKKGKWGYINLKGRTLIKFQYSYANLFVKDTAPVGDENGRFLINRKGKRISKYYDRIESGVGENDLTIVSKGQLNGMINGKGEEIIPIKYKNFWYQRGSPRNINRIGELRNGLIHAIDFLGKTTIFKRDGEPVFFSQYGRLVFFQKGMASIDKGDNQWILEDGDGHQLLPEFLQSTHVHNRYFIVSENEKYGLYDVISKDFLIPIKFDHINFRWKKNGYDIYCSQKGKEFSYQLIENKLEELTPPELKPYYDGSEKFYKIYNNGKSTLLDKDKNEVEVKDFHYGHIYQYHKKEGWLKLYEEGENEKSTEFKTIIKAKIGDELKWITPNGKIYLPKDLKTNEIRITKNLIHFEGINNSYSGLKLLNGKITFPETGVADTYISDGFIFISDNNYKGGFYFTSNDTYKFFGKLQRPYLMEGFPLRWVMENEKYRFINNQGEFVNELLFDFVGIPSEGLIAVEKDEKIGFMNGDGKMIIPLDFETDYSTKNTFKFQEGIAHVLKNGKYGFINTKGETIIPFEYDIVFPAKNGEIVVWKNQEWSVLRVKDFIQK